MATAELTQGMKVRSSDGASLGKIIQVAGDHFLVEKGFFFPKDYAVPISMLRECRDGEAWLTMSRDELQKGDYLEHAAVPGGGEAGARGREDERARAWTDTRPARTQAEGMKGERMGAGTEGERRMTLSDEELEARVERSGDVERTEGERGIDEPEK